MAAFAALVRLIEMELTGGSRAPSLVQLLQERLPVPLMASALALLVFLACRRWASRWGAGVGALVGVGVAAVVLGGTSRFGLWASNGWLSLEAILYLRGDVAFVLALALGVGLAESHGPSRWRRRARRLAHALTWTLGVFYVLELAVLLGFGNPGLYYPLKDFIDRLGTVLPMLLRETSPLAVALAAVPFLPSLALAAWRRLQARVGGAPERRVGGLAVLVPALGVLAMMPATPDLHAESAVERFLRSALEDGQEEVGEAEPPFSAEHLRLVPTARAVRRNVVVVVLESVRASATTPYAPALPTTPFLAGLAARGALVE
ncbi:MAG TPA: hypothetical protein VD963_00740, partial [Phycisphaerales bacterium]|nr:hypothetical protein [Phycisphaerales bacterium]